MVCPTKAIKHFHGATLRTPKIAGDGVVSVARRHVLHMQILMPARGTCYLGMRLASESDASCHPAPPELLRGFTHHQIPIRDPN